MSNMDELKRLESDMKASEELRKNLDEAVRRIAAEGKAQNDGEVMVAAAKELGYDISIAALEQMRAETEDLDSEELQAVAGGVDNSTKGQCDEDFICSFVDRGKFEDEKGHDGFCFTGWHCYTVTLHTDTNEIDVSCWSDHRCVLAYLRD